MNNINQNENEENFKDESEYELGDYDLLVTDSLEHHLYSLSSNPQKTHLTALDRFMVESKTPLFHHDPEYDPHSLV